MSGPCLAQIPVSIQDLREDDEEDDGNVEWTKISSSCSARQLVKRRSTKLPSTPSSSAVATMLQLLFKLWLIGSLATSLPRRTLAGKKPEDLTDHISVSAPRSIDLEDSADCRVFFFLFFPNDTYAISRRNHRLVALAQECNIYITCHPFL